MSDDGGGTVNPARAFYDRISRVYDTLADRDEHEAREQGLRLLAVQKGERVLEIGFGTGHAIVDLARAVGPTGHVEGVDISPGMLAVAHERVETEDLADRVHLGVAEVPPLPFEDRTFDAVSMSFTLELFSDDSIPELLGEVARVLAPGGRVGVVAMSAAAAGEHESVLTHTYKWLHRHFPHIVDCRPIAVGDVLEGAGFRISKCAEMSIWTLRVEAIVCNLGA